MQGIRITFDTDYSSEFETEQRKRVKDITSFMIENDVDFQFYHRYNKDKEFTILAKFYDFDEKKDEITHKLKNVNGVSVEEFQVCLKASCYKAIAVPSITCPIFDRHGEEFHKIHEYCEEHAGAVSTRRLARTLETINVRPGEHWVSIQVWKWPLFWIAQRIWQEWDHGDYERPCNYPYLDATPMLCGKTKEQAIERARNYKK